MAAFHRFRFILESVILHSLLRGKGRGKKFRKISHDNNINLIQYYVSILYRLCHRNTINAVQKRNWRHCHRLRVEITITRDWIQKIKKLYYICKQYPIAAKLIYFLLHRFGAIKLTIISIISKVEIEIWSGW